MQHHQIELYSTKKGLTSCKIDGKNLHSRFSPDIEAKKFIANLDIRDGKTIIFIGPGLGYVLPELLHSYPNSNILVISLHSKLLSKKLKLYSENICYWEPNNVITIESFLFNNFKEIDFLNFEIIEWLQSKNIFEIEYRQIISKIKDHFIKVEANIKHTGNFGKKVLSNSIMNWCSNNFFYDFPKVDGDILITASGPSLNNCIQDIKKYRANLVILATSSSLKILETNKIYPDFVISTDPGFWANYHLYKKKSGIKIITPLSASLLYKDHGLKIIPFNQKSYIDSCLFRETEITTIPEAPTVISTAIESCKIMNAGRIAISGLDLCYNDIISHAKPHAFNSLIEKDNNRLSPIENKYYIRAVNQAPCKIADIRISESMEYYFNYLKQNNDSFRRVKPFFRELYKDENDISISELEGKVLECNKLNMPNLNVRREQVSSQLSSWITEISNDTEATHPLLYSLSTIETLKFRKSKENLLSVKEPSLKILQKLRSII